MAFTQPNVVSVPSSQMHYDLFDIIYYVREQQKIQQLELLVPFFLSSFKEDNLQINY